MPVMGKNVGGGWFRSNIRREWKILDTTIGTGWDGIIRLEESVSE